MKNKKFIIHNNTTSFDDYEIFEFIVYVMKKGLLSNKETEYCYCKVDNLKNISKIEEMENQQKKFIEYLENEIKERKIQILGYHPTTQLLIEQIIETEKKVLSKYKEIIGDDK